MTKIIDNIEALRSAVGTWRAQGKKIALVPTMGALHTGHLSLVAEALKLADICIVSIFVNPKQFGPNEDLDAYPRTFEADIAKLEEAGAHVVFYPSAAEMYPQNFATTISVGGITESLEGEHRPGHFDGVATIVSKLLLQVLPDTAIFGEKDYQQLLLIKRLVQDLNIPVTIRGAATMRDQNGLALSSRNAYLSPAEYEIAVSLNKTLHSIADKIAQGATDYAALEAWGQEQLVQSGFRKVDYIAIRDPETLSLPADNATDLRILAAAYLGKTRLIDNINASRRV